MYKFTLSSRMCIVSNYLWCLVARFLRPPLVLAKQLWTAPCKLRPSSQWELSYFLPQNLHWLCWAAHKCPKSPWVNRQRRQGHVQGDLEIQRMWEEITWTEPLRLSRGFRGILAPIDPTATSITHSYRIPSFLYHFLHSLTLEITSQINNVYRSLCFRLCFLRNQTKKKWFIF